MQKENDREIQFECFRRAGFVRHAESCERCQGHELLPQGRLLQERRSLQEGRWQEDRLLQQRRSLLQERGVLQESTGVLAV